MFTKAKELLIMVSSGVVAQTFAGYLFNGTSAYIQVNRSAVLEPSASITVEARMMFTGLASGQPSGNPRILTKYTTAVGGYGLYFTKTTSTLTFRLYINGVSQTVNWSAIGWATDSLHHVAGTFNGSTMYLYADGVQVSSTVVSGTITNDPACNLFFGSFTSTTNYYKGFLDEIRVWSIARTQASLQADMWGEVDPASTGLLGYWKMNEPSGTSALDSTANANNGNTVACTRTTVSQ